MRITRNPTMRVRQAVRGGCRGHSKSSLMPDNNVPLLARLQDKYDLRNSDSNRLTSLSWAAIEGCLEVFEWLLLDYGHDDQELSRVGRQSSSVRRISRSPQDVDNNTILHLLASVPSPPSQSPHTRLQSSSAWFPPRPSQRSIVEQLAISLRMTHLYCTLFPFLLDWSNAGGKSALHVAAQAGNTGFINLLCDFGADLDLTDLQGNTPLHYASAWGHVETVKVLLERGCQFAGRNYEGFTASDFAYSHMVMGVLQSTARELFEERRLRRKAEGGEDRREYSR
jgi:ankyrin repeat protein